MIDQCVIDRETRGVLNESTAVFAASSWALIYSGKCRVKGPHAGAITVTERDAGGAQQSTQWQTLVLPFGEVLGAKVGDRVRVSGSAVVMTTYDEDTPYDEPVIYPGEALFAVVGEVATSTMTARSLLIEAISS